METLCLVSLVQRICLQFQITFGSFLRQGLEESGEVVHALVQPEQVEEPILRHQNLLSTTYNFLWRQKCKSWLWNSSVEGPSNDMMTVHPTIDEG